MLNTKIRNFCQSTKYFFVKFSIFFLTLSRPVGHNTKISILFRSTMEKMKYFSINLIKSNKAF